MSHSSHEVICFVCGVNVNLYVPSEGTGKDFGNENVKIHREEEQFNLISRENRGESTF